MPEEVRDKILAICSRHLSPNGLAYISYNTLPGWRMRDMVRDILRFHTRHGSGPAEKVRLAESLLEGLEGALSDQDALSAQFLCLR